MILLEEKQKLQRSAVAGANLLNYPTQCLVWMNLLVYCPTLVGHQECSHRFLAYFCLVQRYLHQLLSYGLAPCQHRCRKHVRLSSTFQQLSLQCPFHCKYSSLESDAYPIAGLNHLFSLPFHPLPLFFQTKIC